MLINQDIKEYYIQKLVRNDNPDAQRRLIRSDSLEEVAELIQNQSSILGVTIGGAHLN